MGGGFGGFDSDGNYVDAEGNTTTTPPLQINAIVHANPAIPVLIGIMVLAAIVLVLRVARDEVIALRILDVAMLAIAAVAMCSVVAGYAWFFATGLDYWTGSGIHYTGFPFASVNVTTQPMPAP